MPAMQKWERFFPNPDYMNIPSFSRSVSRGSAVGWFLVLLLVCGAGAGYYLYQDNLAKRKAAQELTAERKLKEKKAREAAEKQRIKREREIREKKEKERLAAQKAYEEAQEEKARQAAEAAHTPENPFLAAFGSFRDADTLTREMAQALIERVYVDGDSNIEIVFRYRDEYKELCTYLERRETDA